MIESGKIKILLALLSITKNLESYFYFETFFRLTIFNQKWFELYKAIKAEDLR